MSPNLRDLQVPLFLARKTFSGDRKGLHSASEFPVKGGIQAATRMCRDSLLSLARFQVCPQILMGNLMVGPGWRVGESRESGPHSKEGKASLGEEQFLPQAPPTVSYPYGVIWELRLFSE